MKDYRRLEQVFSERELRDALGSFPTGVTVVTTLTPEGDRLGTTVSSFNSVSLDPPLILFSIARHSRAFATWLATRHFAVNVLAQDQSDLSVAFSRALAANWNDIAHCAGSHGVPLVAESLACLECDRYAHYDGGDHVIIVGRVTTVHCRNRPDTSPLVFFRGKYEQLAARRLLEPTMDGVEFQHGW